MSDSPRTQAPSETLEDIDEQLTFISNILVHGVRAERKRCFERADEWLDKRLVLKPEPSQEDFTKITPLTQIHEITT